jgi:hypothetical protein
MKLGGSDHIAPAEPFPSRKVRSRLKVSRGAVVSPGFPSLLELNDVVTDLPGRFENVRVRGLAGAQTPFLITVPRCAPIITGVRSRSQVGDDRSLLESSLLLTILLDTAFQLTSAHIGFQYRLKGFLAALLHNLSAGPISFLFSLVFRPFSQIRGQSIADAEKRTSNAGPLLRTSSPGLQSVVLFWRTMSGGRAAAKDVVVNMEGRQAR